MPNGLWTKAVALVAFLGGASANGQDRPPRQGLASNNLCADQYLLALAKPPDIAALSPFAVDPALSLFFRSAAAYPSFRDDSESVLALGPGTVFVSEYTRASTAALLRRAGLRVEIVPEIVKLVDLPNEIRTVGRATDSMEKADILASALEATLSGTSGAFSASGLSVLVYDRGGYVDGTDSLTGAILDHLGVRNVAGTSGNGPVSVEEVLALHPDLLILKTSARNGDKGILPFLHPVLSEAYPERARILLPLPLTICSGPGVTEALTSIHGRIADFLQTRNMH